MSSVEQDMINGTFCPGEVWPHDVAEEYFQGLECHALALHSLRNGPVQSGFLDMSHCPNNSSINSQFVS